MLEFLVIIVSIVSFLAGIGVSICYRATVEKEYREKVERNIKTILKNSGFKL